ncbi:MAG TPA: nitrilase-related carbon-nitrogen hydrolase [Planctomycetota bacterium]|nr:nitrilase-related carbon-nitrogen hydrolase [Planctomycetota bacterium]
MPGPLPIAAFAFTASHEPQANAAAIHGALADAAAAGARVLLTPECALPGYPSAARGDLASLDWCALQDAEDELALDAQRRGIVLVLGTVGRFGGGCGNEALVCGAVAPVRYRKRCLTPTDLKHFVAGDRPCTIDAFGWKLGIAICFDVRFADVFADLAAADADAFLVIAHMAGPDPDPGTKAAVVPRLLATRAAEWATPLAFCNSAVADRYCDSAVYDARGMEIAHAADRLLRADLRHRDTFDAWYAGLRREHLARWRSR